MKNLKQRLKEAQIDLENLRDFEETYKIPEEQYLCRYCGEKYQSAMELEFCPDCEAQIPAEIR